MTVWDPIGVGDEINAQDEYEGYLGGVLDLLTSGASNDHSCGSSGSECSFLPRKRVCKGRLPPSARFAFRKNKVISFETSTGH
jgi:hypothetical protein